MPRAFLAIDRWLSTDLGLTLLFGWAAEVSSSCIFPHIQVRGYDISAALANALGAFAFGVSTGVEASISASIPGLVRLASCFRGGFVAIFTSLAFLPEHGAELSWAKKANGSQANGGRRADWIPALGYIGGSVAAGLAANKLGDQLGRATVTRRIVSYLSKSKFGGFKLRLILFTLVAGCIGRAALSALNSSIFPRGFVSDPNRAEFMHQAEYRWRDFAELSAGLFWSTAALLLGDFVASGAGFFTQEATAGIAWGTFRCNFVACAIVTGCCRLKEWKPVLVDKVMFGKLLSSFTGGLSAFGQTMSDTIMLCKLKSTVALANIALNLGICVGFCALLLRHQRAFESVSKKS